MDKLKSSADMRALEILQELIDEMLENDFEENHKASLTGVVVKEKDPLELDSEQDHKDVAVDATQKMGESLGLESDEPAEVEEVSIAAAIPVEKSSDDSDDEDMINKLRALLK
jgi:hypothetical protein